MQHRVVVHWSLFGLFVYVAAVAALVTGDVTSHRPIQYLTALLGALVAPLVAVPLGAGVVYVMRRLRTKETIP
jgi:hypothetical protein